MRMFSLVMFNNNQTSDETGCIFFFLKLARFKFKPYIANVERLTEKASSTTFLPTCIRLKQVPKMWE